jgi:hypothetical protein
MHRSENLSGSFKVSSLIALYELLPEQERIITDVLRQIVLANMPAYCREKISFNVPYFYGNKGICIIWPSTIPRGGIRNGVLFGLWQGRHLRDPEHYLTHGTNKKVFYKIFNAAEEINEAVLSGLLKEAVALDRSFSHNTRG